MHSGPELGMPRCMLEQKKILSGRTELQFQGLNREISKQNEQSKIKSTHNFMNKSQQK